MAATPTRNPVSTANVMGHPLHPILVTLPIGLFGGTFFSTWFSGRPETMFSREALFGCLDLA
jgi:uncharacterized membrane protein